MKNFWKAIGLAALAAAVPIRVKKDEATGRKKYQSLLLSVDVGPGENGEGTGIELSGEGLINSAITGAVNAKREADLFTDDPEEAVLFADGELVPEEESSGPVSAESGEPAAEKPDEPAAIEEDSDPEL